MRAALLAGLLAAAGIAAAQTSDDTVGGLESLNGTPLPSFPLEGGVLPLDGDSVETIEGGIVVEELTIQSEEPVDQAVAEAGGAVLRGLDKVSGAVTDLDLGVGETGRVGKLTVSLGECRYPVANPTGDAYAWVEISADGIATPQFRGWMVASSPALSALDNPRYDVWVIRCRSS